jgi:hypothetical protein
MHKIEKPADWSDKYLYVSIMVEPDNFSMQSKSLGQILPAVEKISPLRMMKAYASWLSECGRVPVTGGWWQPMAKQRFQIIEQNLVASEVAGSLKYRLKIILA